MINVYLYSSVNASEHTDRRQKNQTRLKYLMRPVSHSYKGLYNIAFLRFGRNRPHHNTIFILIGNLAMIELFSRARGLNTLIAF